MLVCVLFVVVFFFFFQAEDGIRDWSVTGVQTCALPISHLMAEALAEGATQVAETTAQLLRITGEQIQKGRWHDEDILSALNGADAIAFGSPTYMGGVSGQFKCRSEERRVGKECRSRWSPYH